jgi:hypothetical protein
LTLKSQRHSGDIPSMEIVMTTRRSVILGSLAAWAGLTVVACSSEPTTIDTATAKVSASIGAGFDTANVIPGAEMPVVASVENIHLVDPTAEPSAGDAATAGHLGVFLDDTTGTALLLTAETSFNVTIPAEATAGKHTLICRVFKHDGTPTAAHSDLSFTVRAATGTSCTTATNGEMTCTTGNTTCVSSPSGTTACTTGNTTCTGPTGSTPTGPTTCTTQGTTTTCVTGTTTCTTTAG